MDLENAEIEWEKYNFIQRFIFWCVLNYKVTLPLLFGFITIIMIVNCRIASVMLKEQEKEKQKRAESTFKTKPRVKIAKVD